MTIETIDNELKALEAEQRQQQLDHEKLLQKATVTELSKQEFSFLNGLDMMKEIFRRRRAKLEAEKQQIANEGKFQALESLLQGQAAHKAELAAMNAELAAIESRRLELIEQRTEKEAYNHAPMFQAIHLRAELGKVDSRRVMELLKRYGQA